MLFFLPICKEKISIRIDLLQTGDEPIEKIPVSLDVFKRQAAIRNDVHQRDVFIITLRHIQGEGSVAAVTDMQHIGEIQKISEVYDGREQGIDFEHL